MTEPLTPPECDLRGLPFMPLDVVRLGDSDLVALSTGDEFKAAVMLWTKAWLQVPAASLPDDERILAHLSGAGARWKKLKPMALHGFVKCSDGRWYHPVIAEKAREAWKHRLQQRERAAKRWDKEKPSGGNATAYPDASPTGQPAADATAYPTAMQGTGTVKGIEEKAPSQSSVINSIHPSSSTTSREFDRVCEAAGWRPPSDAKRALALAELDGWMDGGFDLELDILPGVRRAVSEQPGKTGSLKRFTTTIAAVHAERLHVETSPDDKRAAMAKRADFFDGIGRPDDAREIRSTWGIEQRVQ